ncbi:hypothetical protein C2S53_019811 [Perilla frutescens var. hirtella]|uniref:G3BP-like protein n=1 Tax=Perilla frutescens var. hirtella TaxID=608512 RepID=A0AAD4PBX3_PERFH|nr:hypothetical protein C2S53_019811 [Perilla frutescens var. hirtella]
MMRIFGRVVYRSALSSSINGGLLPKSFCSNSAARGLYICRRFLFSSSASTSLKSTNLTSLKCFLSVSQSSYFQGQRSVFIQTQATPNPASLMFYPGKPVMESGSADFPNAGAAMNSPLAKNLFGIDDLVIGVSRSGVSRLNLGVSLDGYGFSAARHRCPAAFEMFRAVYSLRSMWCKSRLLRLKFGARACGFSVGMISIVGTYFVGQYYQMLQNQPEFVHQFYSDSSTMLRIEGNTRETASAMVQIHQLVMSLSYTGIEIKTAHSLESWNGGVLVMVSGSVHIKGYNVRKKFVETFFLAPQEKGYFVLNDIFHYVDEELVLQHPIAYLPQSNLDTKIHSSTLVREQVSNYVLGGDIQSREFAAPAKIEENGAVNSYNYPEEQIQQVPETGKILEENFAVQSNGSLQGTMNSVPDHFSPPVEEPVVEPQKHTYASILQVAKGQFAPAVSSQPSFNKPTTPDWQHGPETPNHPSDASSNLIERSGTETLEETLAMEDEVEVKSVYVRNVPTNMSASEIGEEFKKFGKLKPDGVAIRTRKDIDVCYAFVEFDDISGVQNAIKASMVIIGGYELYIEGRRPNRNNSIRGGRARGRGRISYQIEGTRGRFGGRGFSRVSNQDGYKRPYSRPRGNGFYRQERPYSNNQQGSSNGQHHFSD